MIRRAVLTFLTVFSIQTLAQSNRAPWILPFMGSQGARPGMGFTQPPALAGPGQFSQAPALRPYMGTSGLGSYGYQRPRPFMSPWGYNQNHYGRPGFGGGSSLIGSLLQGLFGLFGGNSSGYGNNGGFNLGNLFGGNNFSNSYPQSYAPNYTPDYSSQYLQPAPATAPALQPYQPTSAPDTAPLLTAGRSDVVRGDDTGFTDPSVRGPRNPADDAVQVVPDQLTPGEQLQVNAINDAQREAQNAPVWAPFIARFQRCAPGCVPIGYSAWRGSCNNPRRGCTPRSPGWRPSTSSCHGGGRSLDLFGMRCADGQHMAINSNRRSGKFAQLVQCLSEGRINSVQRLAPGQLGCLWHNHPGADKTTGHRDHVHVTIGCHGGNRW